jgi:hypothetical protein
MHSTAVPDALGSVEFSTQGAKEVARPLWKRAQGAGSASLQRDVRYRPETA